MIINHIAVPVTDISRSKRFYRKYLQLPCVFEKEIAGDEFSTVTAMPEVRLRFAVLKPKNSDVQIELVQFLHQQQPINRDFRHLAFAADNLDTLYRKLKRNRVPTLSAPVTITQRYPGITGKRFFYFRDPDGNLIEAFQANTALYSSK